MSNKNFKGKNPVEESNAQNVANEEATNLQEQAEKKAEETTVGDNTSDELAALQQKYDELNDTHLRLRAEFDNYRKRTLREKSDLIKSGGENALTNLLPVIDDFERALQNIEKAEDMKAVAEGVDLIYTKFVAYLKSQGVKLDCVQTGYTLNEKVIRHAKVVVGE